MNKKKTLLITAFHSFISKNILNTDVLKLIQSARDIRIFLIVPDVKEEFFRSVYEKGNVSVVGVPVRSVIKTRKAKIFSVWSHLLIKSNYLKYKRHERLDAQRNIRGYVKFAIETAMEILCVGNPIVRWIFRQSFMMARYPEVSSVFDKLMPDAVFSTDAFDESDSLFAAEARRRGIRLITMVRSWDNCYSKGLLRVIPDRLIVNNETIKAEAEELHQIPADHVYVLGSPQYDIFHNTERTPRETFFSSMGLDPAKKIVLFAPAGSILSDTDVDIVDMLYKAMKEDVFGMPVQFLVRNHPNHPADMTPVAGKEGFVVEDPGKVFNDNPKDTELTFKDNIHLADELYYADVVVWVATTLPLDAVVFDKPLVSINFDGYKQKTYYNSVRKYHDEDHMIKMLKLGGVQIVNAKDELVAAIRRYLTDPLTDAAGRELIRKQQFFKLDGKAGERIGLEVLNFISIQ